MILFFLIGLCIGSFLLVLVDRLPRSETIIKGRSYCEHCKKMLAWYDLIPLLSFFSLGGKCRYCKKKLSWYYPVVELTTGVLFILTYIIIIKAITIITVIQMLFYLYIISSLIVIFFTDLKYGIIPNKVIYPAIFVTFLYILHTTYYILPNHFLSALGAFLFFLFLFIITKGKGMGLGDVKYAFFMGLLLGFPYVIIGLYVAFLTGAIVAIILVLWRKKKFRGGAIPFGPFLVIGTIVGLFWGDFLVQQLVGILVHP